MLGATLLSPSDITPLARLSFNDQSLQRDLESQQLRGAPPASHDEEGTKLPAAGALEDVKAAPSSPKHRRSWSIGEDPSRTMDRLRLTERNLTVEVAALQVTRRDG